MSFIHAIAVRPHLRSLSERRAMPLFYHLKQDLTAGSHNFNFIKQINHLKVLHFSL